MRRNRVVIFDADSCGGLVFMGMLFVIALCLWAIFGG